MALTKRTKYIIDAGLILLWLGLFYFQFERPFISRLAHNLSPSLLQISIKHSLFYLAWISLPLIIIVIFKGRFFCWRICPVGLLQDFIPARGKIKYTKTNLYFYLFLFMFSFWGLSLIAILDPLVIFNRAIVALKYHFLGSIVFFMPLFLILAVNLVFKRFWCLKLCPLGAFVDFVNLIKKRIKQKKKIDLDKRKTLLLLGTGLLAGFIVKRYNYLGRSLSKRLLRPPGALPENEFTERCIRCGSCLAICLTGGLRPTLLEAGLEGIYTPRLVPKIGECDEFCNRCGQVCPTQAIKNLPLSVKRNVKIGIAKVTRAKCIAWSDDRLCLVCKEFCPYLAIESVANKNGIVSPLVSFDQCRGCGLCEKQCRAGIDSAIKVYNHRS